MRDQEVELGRSVVLPVSSLLKTDRLVIAQRRKSLPKSRLPSRDLPASAPVKAIGLVTNRVKLIGLEYKAKVRFVLPSRE